MANSTLRMDAPLKEVAKLEKLQVFYHTDISNSKTVRKSSIDMPEVMDSLLSSLQQLRQRIEVDGTLDVSHELCNLLQDKKKEMDDKQKEIHASLGKLGKAIDKKFPDPIPSYDEMFTSDESVHALEKTIANHLMRTGQFEASNVFREESGVELDSYLKAQFIEMHDILKGLDNRDLKPALKWVEANRPFLSARSSPLEFHLYRSHYLHLLTSSAHSSHPPLEALAYLKSLPSLLHDAYSNEIYRLLTCMLYLPVSRLMTSPYADLADPALHTDLRIAFAREYCARLCLSKHLPLRVVGDLGGGGALTRIEKGRKVMRERKSEWSQTNELPMEIPLPPENRYHSIFACPVSKEQSSEINPPMLMSCGHVVNKDSLEKLKKPAVYTRVKCPYCPVESHAHNCTRVFF